MAHMRFAMCAAMDCAAAERLVRYADAK